jgi:hypothetical protein
MFEQYETRAGKEAKTLRSTIRSPESAPTPRRERSVPDADASGTADAGFQKDG